MMDAISGEHIISLDLGPKFVEHYGYPYILVHRGDLLGVELQVCQANSLITLESLTDKPSRLVNFLPWGSRTAIVRSTARACSAWRCQKMVDLDEFLRAASNRVDTKNSF